MSGSGEHLSPRLHLLPGEPRPVPSLREHHHRPRASRRGPPRAHRAHRAGPQVGGGGFSRRRKTGGFNRRLHVQLDTCQSAPLGPNPARALVKEPREVPLRRRRSRAWTDDGGDARVQRRQRLSKRRQYLSANGFGGGRRRCEVTLLFTLLCRAFTPPRPSRRGRPRVVEGAGDGV